MNLFKEATAMKRLAMILLKKSNADEAFNKE
jgi:hypothetical protein